MRFGSASGVEVHFAIPVGRASSGSGSSGASPHQTVTRPRHSSSHFDSGHCPFHACSPGFSRFLRGDRLKPGLHTCQNENYRPRQEMNCRVRTVWVMNNPPGPNPCGVDKRGAQLLKPNPAIRSNAKAQRREDAMGETDLGRTLSGKPMDALFSTDLSRLGDFRGLCGRVFANCANFRTHNRVNPPFLSVSICVHLWLTSLGCGVSRAAPSRLRVNCGLQIA